MTEVRTRDEAISSVDQALSAWSTNVTGFLKVAQSVARAVVEQAQRQVRTRRSAVAAIRALLDAADQDNKSRLEAELRRAENACTIVQRASADAQRIQESVAQLSRAHASGSATQVSAARSELANMSRALEGYRGGSASFGGGSSGQAPCGTVGDDLSQLGLTALDVSAADLASNPILDGDPGAATFGKGGLTRADYRWAVQTWNDTIGPGVARGRTRDDFYDMFLGSDRIRVSRRGDGSLDVTGGRHRLLIARELGIKSLPGEVH